MLEQQEIIILDIFYYLVTLRKQIKGYLII